MTYNGEECIKLGEGLYKYKECVYIPPLAMIDEVNASIQSKVGPDKCSNFILENRVNVVIHSTLKSENVIINLRKISWRYPDYRRQN